MERIQSFFTKEEAKQYEEFKKSTGMAYHAIVTKAIDYYLSPNSPYLNESVEAREYNGNKIKVRKDLRMSATAYERLTYYCALHDLYAATVAARAISIYIQDKKNNFD